MDRVFISQEIPSIGYYLAKGGEQFIVGCTDYEIKRISNLLINATDDNIYDIFLIYNNMD